MFGIHEIHASPFLQRVYWALLVGFGLSFYLWSSQPFIDVGNARAGFHVCPPYLQSCARLYFLTKSWRPWLYGFLCLLLILSAVFALCRAWTASLLCLVPLTAFKFAYVTVFSYQPIIEYEYFHIPEVLVFLFARRKVYFLKLTFAASYFLAATVKFSPAWIAGEYFTSLIRGLPLINKNYIPLATNAVAIFEITSPYFLLHSCRRNRWGAVALWMTFHLYSGILVQFPYPSYCLPLLCTLFLFDEDTHTPTSNFSSSKSYVGWAVVAGLFFLQFFPYALPDHNPYVMQGRRFGAQMFDANHQCSSHEKILFKDGTADNMTFTSSGAASRCSPYTRLFRLHQICKKLNVQATEWSFASSINGGPFYELVRTANACDLEFFPFSSNDWIKLPESGAQVVGYPSPNRLLSKNYLKNVIRANADTNMRVPSQAWLELYFKPIRAAYWSLWFIFFILYAWYEWTRKPVQI